MLCPWQRELQKFFQQPPVSCVQICLPELMLQTQWGHNLVWHRGCFVSMGPPTHVWHTISSFSSELSNRRKLLPLVQSYILHLQCRSHAHIDVGVNMEYCPGCLQWKGGHSNKILFDTIIILSVPWGKGYKQSWGDNIEDITFSSNMLDWNWSCVVEVEEEGECPQEVSHRVRSFGGHAFCPAHWRWAIDKRPMCWFAKVGHTNFMMIIVRRRPDISGSNMLRVPEQFVSDTRAEAMDDGHLLQNTLC